MRPTSDEHRELNKLRENPVILEFLERSLADEKDKLVTMVDMDKLRVLQGGTRRLAELILLIKTDAKREVTQAPGKR